MTPAGSTQSLAGRILGFFAAGMLVGIMLIVWWLYHSGWSPRIRLAYLGYEATPRDFAEAAGRGDLAAAKIFVEAGVPLAGLEHYRRWNPLDWAVISGKPEVVEFLLAAGRDAGHADYGNASFILAAYHGQEDIVRRMLKRGVQLEFQQEGAGGNALFWAARTGQTGIVRLLHEAGLDPNSKDFRGLTPVQAARKRNHMETVGYLAALPEVQAFEEEEELAKIPKAQPVTEADLAPAPPSSEPRMQDLDAPRDTGTVVP